jgi:hypothetical protein
MTDALSQHDAEDLMSRVYDRLLHEGLDDSNLEIATRLAWLDRKGDRAGISRLLDNVAGAPSTDQIRIGWMQSHSRTALYVVVYRGFDPRIFELGEDVDAPTATLRIEVNFRLREIKVVPTGADSVGEREIHVAAVVLEELGVPAAKILEALHRAVHIAFAKHDWLPDPDPTWKKLAVGEGPRGGPMADDATILRWLRLRLRTFSTIKNPRLRRV